MTLFIRILKFFELFFERTKPEAKEEPTKEETKVSEMPVASTNKIVISKHLSYNEAIYSETALKKDISNKPGMKEIRCMRVLCC